MIQRRCKQCNRKAISQHRVEGQVVSSHTQYDQLWWKCFWFSRHVIESMPQTFLACVEAGMCDCMPLSERLACIQEKGVPVSCPDSVKQVVWIPWHIFGCRSLATNMFLGFFIRYTNWLRLGSFFWQLKLSGVSQCTILKCPVAPSWVNMPLIWPFVMCCFMLLHDSKTNHYSHSFKMSQ